MSKLRVIISVCLSGLLVACSSNHTPAPVTTLYSGKTTSTHKINIKGSRYKVKKGDTLFAIAFSANKDVRTLAKINKIKPPYTIYPNQIIHLQYPRNKNKKNIKYTKVNHKSQSLKQKSNKTQKKELDKPKQREYVQRQATQKSTSTKALYNNKVLWKWPAEGKVTRRFSIKENGYKGLEISNKPGTSVRAAAGGVVVYAGSALRGYGNLIILKHTDDYLSAYAHNAKLLVREQQKVKVGEKIAEMGSTDAAKTALRFEIRFKGQAVNPAKYLP
ncbi:peptidoglycan DD-metalloendopeptidase family protein [Pseudoalteromonas piscicida]|uniref:Peptidoglycan-binding protein n=1 Tax=Pseudoalteromonas piscicida TaxID=43662 RepID=A0A2A5JWA5_PSEO7|nr:peptidoglycan DD-metalloendopeptidase family protein [Pseudoalteromonas piscicida]PCK33763.1 peptidoglycan-binding protein [Pseudoalteromonas piscicida]